MWNEIKVLKKYRWLLTWPINISKGSNNTIKQSNFALLYVSRFIYSHITYPSAYLFKKAILQKADFGFIFHLGL